MLYLHNIHWLSSEIFILISTLALLVYGVIYSKLQGKYSQQFKITWLSIFTLSLGLYLKYITKANWDLMESTEAISISGGVMELDTLTINIQMVVLVTSIVILLLSLDYYAKEKLSMYEYTQLILLSVLGMQILVMSRDLITLYLAVELISLSSYVLAGLERKRQYSSEAALKYFLLGALASGLLLLGCALIYTFSAETSFSGLSAFLWYSQDNLGLKAGVVLVLVALLFKLAAAPFHMWAPDVYEGSPTIVTAYMAIVPKIATLAILIILSLRIWLPLWNEGIQTLLLMASVISLMVGALGGLNQTKIKRLMAYSAIGHMGFILLAISTSSELGLEASLFYIMLYIIMSISMFTIILGVYNGSLNYISQLSGLSRTQPLLAATLTVSLFSMAGIPPLAGFLSKYLVLLSCIENSFYMIAIIAVLASVVSSFYYLRIIKWIYFNDTAYYNFKDLGDVLTTRIEISYTASTILAITTWLNLTLLLYPNTILTAIIKISHDALII